MNKTIMSLMLVTILIPSACKEKGTVEKAGERVDEVIDNIKQGDSPLKEKGPMEKVGESIDDTIKQVDKK